MEAYDSLDAGTAVCQLLHCCATKAIPYRSDATLIHVWIHLEDFQSGQWWKLLGAGGGFLKAGYDFYESVNNDDLVGLIKWPPAGCWPESSGPIYGPVLSEDSGHALQGYVKLDNNFAARDSTCSLSASMTGPTAITTCPTMIEPDPPADYSASYYGGGSGTATYQWVLDGYNVSTSQYYTIPNQDLTEGSHHLEVIVSRNGEVSVAVKDIQVTAEPFCQMQ